jgi:hypothetical protein
LFELSLLIGRAGVESYDSGLCAIQMVKKRKNLFGVRRGFDSYRL